MKKINLLQYEHDKKVGDVCGDIEPNVTEDSLFVLDDEVIGFYIKDMGKYSEKAVKLANFANSELLSDRVPKSMMRRSSSLKSEENAVEQFSTILGGVPPKPMFKRNYPIISSVHSVKSAEKFVKSMLLLSEESAQIIKMLAPSVYEKQKEIIEANVQKKWRFGSLFTSSISNFNISAPFHRDAGNIVGCVNVIIAKKRFSQGGNTTVPDYQATVDSSDNSMLVYPAWRNLHAVTPIHVTAPGGYRNSLVFYPLKAFVGI